MKRPLFSKNLLLVFLFVGAFNLDGAGQFISSYSFSQSTGTYNSITGTTLGSGTGLDNQRYAVNLPFNFVMNDSAYSSVYVSMNGFISLGGNPGSGHWMIQSNAGGFQVISGFDYDLASLNTSTRLSHTTTGTAPNRVFTAQWENMGVTGTTALDASFQIKLYETSNNIEIVYGNISLATGSNISVQLGLRGRTNTEFACRASNSSAWSSTTSGFNNTGNIMYTGGFDPPNGITYTYTAPPVCSIPNQASMLILTPATNNISGTFTPSSSTSAQYLVVANQGTVLSANPIDGTTYSVNDSIGNGKVIYKGSSTSFTHSSLPQNTPYSYTVFSFRAGACMLGPVYNTNAPLVGNDTTLGPHKYTWVRTSGSWDFGADTNWSPHRTVPNSLDTLIFDNGGTFTATDVSNQLNGVIRITGNTNVTFNAWLPSSISILWIQKEFTIDSGSTLNLGGTGSLELDCAYQFSTSGTITTNIHGVLNLQNNSIMDVNSSTVTCSGTIRASGAGAVIQNYAPERLVFTNTGVYEHSPNGGVIPEAIYMPNSTVLVNGVTSNLPSVELGQNFGNFIWDCPTQSTDLNINIKLDTIEGNLRLLNTNSHRLTYSSSNKYLTVFGDFEQTNSDITLRNANFYGNLILNNGDLHIISGIHNVHGNVTQNVAHTFTSSGYSTPSRWVLKGSHHQNLNIGGTFASPINYILENPQGATLTGIISVTNNRSVRIKSGGFSGNGFFSYGTTGSKLEYVASSPITASAVEWSVNAQPSEIVIDISGAAPNNKVWLPGDRTFLGKLNMVNGVLALGDKNLTIDSNGFITISNTSNPSTNRFIAVDSTGSLRSAIKPVTSGTFMRNYPIGDLEGTHQESAMNMSVTNNPVKRYLTFNLKNKKHPNETAPTNYLNRYWTITDDHPTTPFSYILNVATPRADVMGNKHLVLNKWTNNTWEQLLFTTSVSTLFSEMYFNKVNSSSVPISGDYTGREAVYTNYTWTGAVDSNYALASNWTPNRNTPAPTDILTFSNGGIDTVVNVQSENITGLQFTNNTEIHLQPSQGGLTTLRLRSDFDITTDELFIENGSALFLDGILGDFSLSSDYQPTAQVNALVDGRFEVLSFWPNNNNHYTNNAQLGFVDGIVSSSGVVAAGGSLGGGGFSGSIDVKGTYEHKYTEVAGDEPLFNFLDSSTYKIIGYTTYGSPMNLPLNCYNLVYDCPNQLSNPYVRNSLVNVRGEFSMVSTGVGQLGVDGFYDQVFNVGSYNQTGGKFVLSLSSSSPEVLLNVTRDFSQTGGTISSNGSGNSRPKIKFSGIDSVQDVSFFSTAPAGQLSYQISNPFGINLSLNGATTSDFDINDNGSLIISTSNPNPINTSLAIKYGTQSSSLIYEFDKDITATSSVFTTSNPPQFLVIDIDSNNALTLPFNRTIPKRLSMIKGNIDIGANVLTLGSSAASVGELDYTSGRIITTTGNFTRWFSNNGLPTSAGIGIGYFPMGTNASDRGVAVYFTSSGAITTPGTISVGHADDFTYTSGLSIPDGTTTLTDRTNASWSVNDGNGLVLLGTSLNLSVSTEDVFNAVNPNSLHLSKASTVVGTHVTASGTNPQVQVNRIGLSQADLVGDFHIATDTPLSTVIISVNTGNWNIGSTWNTGTVPSANDNVIIANGTTVTQNTVNAVRSLEIQPAGSLVGSANGRLSIDSLLENNGVVTLSNDSLRIGAYGGGNAKFQNNGTVNLGAGAVLYVNGSMQNPIVSTYNQTGGLLTIDCNANGDTLSSITVDTVLNFKSTNTNLIAGEILFVDPSVLPTTDMLSFFFKDTNMATTSHSIIFGDGLSVDSSANIYNMKVYNSNTAGWVHIGNLVNRGSAITTEKRLDISTNKLRILGDIQMPNSGGGIRQANYSGYYIEGNIDVQAGNTLYSEGTTSFVGANLQQVTGSGTYSNHISSPNGNFQRVVLNKNGPQNLEFYTGDVTCTNQLYLTNGKIDMKGNTFIKLGGAYIGIGNGWIIGSFEYGYTGTYSNVAFNKIFPIGNQNTETYVLVNGTLDYTSYGSLRVSIIPNDHPAISSSNILPGRSINKHIKIENRGTFNLNPATSITIYWDSTEQDNGIHYSNIRMQRYDSTNNWFNVPPWILGVNYSSAQNVGSDIIAEFQLGEINTTPLVTSQPSNQTICEMTNTSFDVNTSVTCIKQWQQLNASTWFDLSNNTTYSGVTSNTLTVTSANVSMDSSFYRCRLIVGLDTQYSTVVVLRVNPILTPSVVIYAQNDTICAGSLALFTAHVTNGGDNPSYQWKVNGVNVGGNNNSYSSYTWTNTDTVSCVVTSSYPCVSNNTAISNPMTIVVNPMVSPVATITANPGSGICIGGAATFTATVTNGGSNPIYQWWKNNVVVGTNSPTYSDNGLTNGQNIRCIVTSNANCLVNNSDVSNIITMSVTSPVTPNVSISAGSGNVICSGTIANFTATVSNGGATPSYQWFKNGVAVGTNSNTYTDAGLNNNDDIKCVLTSSLGCVTTSMDTSASIIMTVNPTVTPVATITVAPNDTICAGTSVTFTSSLSNQGSTTSYSWRKNGSTTTVSSGPTYTTTSLSNGDVVRLIINTNATCATSNIDTSNAISITVNPVVTPTISISGIDTICQGDTVLFTATSTFGGSSPVYQWKKNNVNVGANSTSYSDPNLNNGDIIECVLTSSSSCATSAMTNSNAVTMVVNPIVTPVVLIAVNPGDTLCLGDNATFTATPMHGGNTPSYQWRVNNTNIGTNSPTYSSTILNTGDQIDCIMTSTNVCASTTLDTSNVISMTMNPILTHSATISALPSTTITSGQMVTFTATGVNSGSNPNYQWKLNGTNVGANQNTYASNTLQDADEVWCEVTSSELCAQPAIVNTSKLKINISVGVNDLKLRNAFLEIYPNPTSQVIILSLKTTSVHRERLKYRLLSLTGDVVLDGDFVVNARNISKEIVFPENTSNGLYILEVNYGDATEMFKVQLKR